MSYQKDDDKKFDKRSNSRKGNRSKGNRRSGPKDRDRDSKPDSISRRDRGPSPNDPRWYVKKDQLMSDVASLSFNEPLGSKLVLDATNNDSITLPGIMNIYTAPSVGITTAAVDRASAVNIAATDIYSFVRYHNSGSKNYDAPDYMLYLLAMDSLYSYISWLIRIYGQLRTFSQLNKYVNAAMLAAHGVRVAGSDSIYTQTAQLRAWINNFIARAAVFAVPASFTYYTRHFWMYSGVYKDEDVAKAQYYMYMPAYLYKYTIDSVTSAGKLVPEPIAMTFDSTVGWTPRTSMNMVQVRTIGENLLNALNSMEDIGIMSGDTLKAFGEGGLFQLNTIPDDYATLPIFSEEVLMQIHNTTFTGVLSCDANDGTLGTKTLEITQTLGIGEGTIAFNPWFMSNKDIDGRIVLDTWKQVVSPEDVMVMTRNVTLMSKPLASGAAFISTTGSDFALCAGSVRWMPGSSTPAIILVYKDEPSPANVTQDVYGEELIIMNERPIRMIVDPNQGYAKVGIDGELSNYRSTDFETIRNIHENAILAMFDVPHTAW